MLEVGNYGVEGMLVEMRLPWPESDAGQSEEAALWQTVLRRYDPVFMEWLLAETTGIGAWLTRHPTDPTDPAAVRAFVAELRQRVPAWVWERQRAFMERHWPDYPPVADDSAP